MPILSFPGEKALRFVGDTSAAVRDADSRPDARPRARRARVRERQGQRRGGRRRAPRVPPRRLRVKDDGRAEPAEAPLRVARDESGKKAVAAAKAQGQGHTSLVTP